MYPSSSVTSKFVLDYSMWAILQEVHKTRITDMDDWDKLKATENGVGQAAAAIRQWRRRPSSFVNSEHCLSLSSLCC